MKQKPEGEKMMSTDKIENEEALLEFPAGSFISALSSKARRLSSPVEGNRMIAVNARGGKKKKVLSM